MLSGGDTDQWEQKLRQTTWWDVSGVVQAAPERVRRSRAFALAAVRKDGKALEHASANSRADHEIVLRAVENTGEALQWASPKLQADKEVVRAALKTSAEAFQFADTTLKSDRGFVLEAVQIKGRALWYAYNDLQDDPEVVMAAVASAGFDAVKMHMHIGLFGNRDFVRLLVHKEGCALRFVDACFQADKEVVLVAVRSTARAIKFASAKLQSDKDVVLAAVQNDGYFLQHVAKHLRCDKDVVLAAVRSHPAALKFALGGLIQDEDCLLAVGRTLADKRSMGGSQRSQNKKVVLSLKFNNADTNTDYATHFMQAMRFDQYFMEFDTYNANAWEKNSCDHLFTDSVLRCRGTDDTCGFRVAQNRGPNGRPSPTCCWRFSFRFHADKAVAAKGFMIQVQEREGLSVPQQLETEMAVQAKLKVFRTMTNAACFHPELLRRLHAAILSWYGASCPDPETPTEVLLGDSALI